MGVGRIQRMGRTGEQRQVLDQTIFIIQIYPQTTMKPAILLLALLSTVVSYLNVHLHVNRTLGNGDVTYSLPFKISSIDYSVPIALRDGEEYLKSTHEKAGKKKKHQKSQHVDSIGVLEATSLQGYSFEGWKRFFMEALLYIEQRYYHDIELNLTSIEIRQSKEGEPLLQDGLITFGPSLADNKIFKAIKEKTDYISKDVVSIYRGVNDKEVQLQLGGYEENFARGHSNGVLFYEVELTVEDGKWKIPFKSMYCTRQRSGPDETFFIANSAMSLSISLESQFVKLPQRFASDLERNFEGSHTVCKITQQKRLMCSNMTSIDLALNYLHFKLDDGVFVNISLYDLKDTYDEKTRETMFFIEFVKDEKEASIGEAFFKTHYVSIDMQDKQLLFSPLNRYPQESYGIYLVRTVIGFALFMVVAFVGVIIWQSFNDPSHRHHLSVGGGGIKLVSYQRPGEYEQRLD